jgi:ATP-dependent 26S proteasome regulatory subunit
LLVMTANHIDHLDAALIRPCHADMKIEFQLADEDMVNRLLCFMYDPKLGEYARGSKMKSFETLI